MLLNLSIGETEEEISNETLPFGCLKNYVFLVFFGLTFSPQIFSNILKSRETM